MKKLIILIVVAVVFSISVYYKYQYVSDDSLIDLVSLRKVDNQTKPQILNSLDEGNHLSSIANQIQIVSDEDLKHSWKNEFGCSVDETCSYELLTAQSYEEALWMKRKGYLSRSVVDSLEILPRKDLMKLERRGNVNAKKLLAISAIRSKNIKLAKSYSRSARAYEQGSETFSLRLMSQAYLLDNQPMLATIELRMASLLGDSDASREYEYMTRNSAREFIDNTNLLAFRFLSTKYKDSSLNQWDDDPRPSGGDGG